MNDNIEYKTELGAAAERLGYKAKLVDGGTIRILGDVTPEHRSALEELRSIGCRIQFETSQGLITVP